MPDLSLPLDCAELLPHREPMRLLDRLVEYQPGQARVTARVAPGGLFVDARGRLSPAAVVELAAQGAAVLKGYEARRKGEPVRIGYLAGIKDFALVGWAGAGEALEIDVRLEFAMDQAALMLGEVRAAGRVIGAGTIKIWEEKAWPSRPVPPEPAPSTSDLARGAFRSAGASPASLAEGGGNAPGDVPLAHLPNLSLDGASADPIGRALVASFESFEPAADENQVVGWFRFGEDFSGFRGHFPGFPILPAVLMPRLALLLAQARLGVGVTLKRIATAKIRQGIFPGQRVRVEVTLAERTGAEPSLKVKLAGPGGAVASFSLGLSIDPGSML